MESILNIALVNQMRFGMMKNRGYYGYRSSILKSGICKYFRRGQHDKYEWCVVEMLLFGVNKLGKSLVTNLMNRLKILVMEEIVCDDERIPTLIRLLRETEQCSTLEDKLVKLLTFVRLSSQCRKGRITSYLNSWWTHNEPELVVSNVVPSKVLKYKKKDDTDELLILGELLINQIETGDEKIMQLINNMYDIEGKFGRRYRRRDGVYLFWEIVEDYMETDRNKSIFKFCLDNFNRKSMKERRYFAIMMGVIVWKSLYKKVNEADDDDVVFDQNIDIIQYIRNRKQININEDYVVKDWHVNRKYGLKKFGEVGSVVVNEDLSLLNNDEKYKTFYIQQKDVEEREMKESIILR